MPRIRTIKPEFWSDEKLAPLPPVTRLVYVGLWSLADDAGRLVDNVKAIDGYLFPETDDSSGESLETLVRLSRITRYMAPNGQKLIQIVNFPRHQKIQHPSAYTLPAPDSTGSVNSHEPLTNGSGDSHKSLTPDLGSRNLDLGSRTTTHTLENAFASAEHNTSNTSESNLGNRLGPNELHTLASFLASLGKGQSASAWVAHINTLLDDGHAPQHVATALRDWPSAGYPLTPANLTAFVKRAARDSAPHSTTKHHETRHSEPRSPRSTGSRARTHGNGPSGSDGLTSHQRDAKHAAELVSARRQRVDGDAWWRYAEQEAASLGKVRIDDVLLHAATLIERTPPHEPPRARP